MLSVRPERVILIPNIMSSELRVSSHLFSEEDSLMRHYRAWISNNVEGSYKRAATLALVVSL